LARRVVEVSPLSGGRLIVDGIKRQQVALLHGGRPLLLQRVQLLANQGRRDRPTPTQ
jgi:hypothetical protein